MKLLLRSATFLLLCACTPAWAQLYGASPFQNGPSQENGSLFVFDPDTLIWLDGRRIFLEGFTVTGTNSVTVHPNLEAPNDALNGTVFAILKVTGVSGRVLATIDPDTGVATQVGNLGDNFASLTFREDGQLFGVTGDGATVPETLYLIDKTNAAKTLAAALGNGADGEAIAYNPVDDFIYHWSGSGTIVFERLQSQPPYLPTGIPIIGTTNGETFGAVWDPCQPRSDGAVSSLGFIGSNINSAFNFWFTTGQVSPLLGSNPDDIRGLALIGGYTCDADLGVGIGSPNPAPAAGDPITIEVLLDNAGQARAMTPTLNISLPPSVTAATTTGCIEDPNGLPSCTPRIFVPRYDTVAMQHFPFQISNLWRGRSVSVSVVGTFDGSGGDVVVTAASGSNDPQPADNTNFLRLGDALFKHSFED
jgi:hypothetical protein